MICKEGSVRTFFYRSMEKTELICSIESVYLGLQKCSSETVLATRGPRQVPSIPVMFSPSASPAKYYLSMGSKPPLRAST